MNSVVFVDTNVLLDAAMPERPDHAWALMLFDEVVYEGLEIRVCATSYKDVYYVLAKYSNEPEARAYVKNLMTLTVPHPVDAPCIALALDSNEPDFEDGIVRACAEQAHVDAIISRDEKAFVRSTVKRLTAREYLETFCDVREIAL